MSRSRSRRARWCPRSFATTTGTKRRSRLKSNPGNERDPQLHDELWSAASGRARCAAPGAGDGRRGRAEGRPAHRAAASWYREAGGVEAVQPVDRLHGPARLRVDDVQRARLCPGDRAPAGRHAADSRAVHPRVVRRGHAPAESPDVAGRARARHRRDDGVPARVQGARGPDGLLRGGLGHAHACHVLPPGRCVSRSAGLDAEVPGVQVAFTEERRSHERSACRLAARLHRCISPTASRRPSTNTKPC